MYLYKKLSFLVVVLLFQNALAQNNASMQKSTQATEQMRSGIRAGVEFNLQSNNIKNAEDTLNKALVYYPEDHEFIRLKAMIELKKKNIDAAKETLNKTAMSEDDIVRAKSLYTLAEVENSAGNQAVVKSKLAIMAADPAFSRAAAFAVNDLQAGRPIRDLNEVKLRAAVQGNKPGWSSTATINSGYDSNISLIPDAGGPKEGGAYVTPSVSVNYIGRMFNRKFSAYGNLGYTANLAEATKDNNNLNLGLGGVWALPGEAGWLHHMSVREDLSLNFVQNPSQKLNVATNTITLQKEAWYTEDSRIVFGLPIGYTVYPGVDDTGDNVRDGATLGFSVSNIHKWSSWDVYQVVAFTRQNSIGKAYRSNAINLSVGGNKQLTNNLSMGLTAGYSTSSYPEASTGRVDKAYNAGLSLTQQWKSMPVWIGGGYNFQKNESTVTTANYQKDIFYFNLTSAFQ